MPEAFQQRHYSPKELAEWWGVSPSYVVKLFRRVTGVANFVSSEQKTMRIPEALVKQVYEQFTKNSELDPRAVSGGTGPKARNASLSRARFGVPKGWKRPGSGRRAPKAEQKKNLGTDEHDRSQSSQS